MGEGHLQGKTEFRGDSSKVGTSKSSDFATGPCRPFPPPELAGSSPFLFGLQGPRPFKVGGHLGALTGHRREAVEILPN